MSSRKIVRTLLTTTEFATRAGCSRTQVRKAIDDGRLPVTLIDRGPGSDPACAIEPKELERFEPKPSGWTIEAARKARKKKRK